MEINGKVVVILENIKFRINITHRLQCRRVAEHVHADWRKAASYLPASSEVDCRRRSDS